MIKPADYIQVLKSLGQSYGRIFYKNSVIFHEGDQGSEVYFIIYGEVKIVTFLHRDESEGPAFNAKGPTHELATLGAGDVFGEMAILDDQPRSASALATEDTEVIIFTREDFFLNIERYPKLGVRFLKVLSNRIRSLDAKLKSAITTCIV